MDKSKVLMGVGALSGLFFFCFFVSVCAIAHKDYVTPGYEGAGTSKLFRIDGGESSHGIFTSFMGFFVVYWHYKCSKEPSSENIQMLLGFLIGLTVILLQSTIIWGNVALDTIELDARKGHLIQGCNDGDDEGCLTILKDGSSCITVTGFPDHIRVYASNAKLKPGCDSAVAFGVFLFLLHTFESAWVWKSQSELATGDNDRGAYGTAGAGPFSGPDATDEDGETYQKL